MEEQRHGDAGDANSEAKAKAPLSADNDTSATGDADDAKVTALDDGLKYTLTAAQALQLFADAHRKVPSLRSIQRYCVEGTLRALKITTTYGQEWLINDASLNAFI